MRVDDATDEIVVELDQPTAKGRIVLRLDIYGIALICPDVDAEPIAFLDLWNRASPSTAAGAPLLSLPPRRPASS